MKDSKVLVVGGGFGGVYAARTLLQRGFDVTLVSRTNFFVFTPLLHEVATGSLNPNDITFEYSDFFQDKDFTFFRETIVEYDFENRSVRTSDGERLEYDYLIISTGADTNFYGTKGSELTLTLKTIEDAQRLKKRIVELAQGIERSVVVTVVGGGPTGVELAFEVEEFLRAIKKHSPTLKYAVRLVHAGNSLCDTFPKSIQNYALRQMYKEGIDVRLGTVASEVTSEAVITKDGEHIESDITVWTAGVTPNTKEVSDEYKDERGNIIVDDYLRIRGREREFAIGDVIVQGERAVPKLAQTASRQGPLAARNINALLQNKALTPYKPHVSGALISLGKGRGAGKIFGVTFKGLVGWVIWRNAYLSKIPGFRNKTEVFSTWLTNFFSSRDLFER